MSTLTIGGTIHFGRAGRGARKVIREGAAPPSVPGRVPRVSRLMALAIRFDGLVKSGVVADYAELAQLGHVTRARVSQVMSLLYLAPAIQEDVLFLPRIEAGRGRARSDRAARFAADRCDGGLGDAVADVARAGAQERGSVLHAIDAEASDGHAGATQTQLRGRTGYSAAKLKTCSPG